MSTDYNTGLYQVFGQPLIRGLGTIWPISGWISGNIDRIEKVTLVVNGNSHEPMELFEVPQPIDNVDYFGTTLLPDRLHFCHYLNSNDIEENFLEAEIFLTLPKKVVKLKLCHELVHDDLIHAPEALPAAKVAICMATHNPNFVLFQRQLNSIIEQTEISWRLIINDDCSTAENYREICRRTATDDRIHVYRNESNLGFYYNFERALNRVHRQFKFVALADQDDYWHVDKLANLISEIGEAHLLYNDMVIEDENGHIISPTFWNQRSNHYKSMSALILANTVTGSASIFRTSLLRKLLPFPARLGNAFHDHWLGLNAAVDNKLAYFDQVQQAYIQHDSNVTGYGQFREINMGESTLSFLSLQRMKAALALDKKNEKYIRFVSNNVKVYFDAYMRRKLQYEILKIRHPHWHKRLLDKIFVSKTNPVQHLLSLHWRIYKKGWMTNNAELSYINAIEVMKQLRVQKSGTD